VVAGCGDGGVGVAVMVVVPKSMEK
jgi:hypothetical protein